MSSATPEPRVVNVAEDFSRYPAGRFRTDGPHSGEALRDLIMESLRAGETVVVQLDGTMGYGASFLDEAFGGLVRVCGLSRAELRQRLTPTSEDRSLLRVIWSHLEGPHG